MFDKKNEITHPSFGMLGFSRRHGGTGTPLFGSSIKHRDTICLTLKTGKVHRELNKDWYFGGRTLFEIEMSGEQFANLLTNMNCGDGVPVTIRATEKLGRLDYFDVPFESKIDQHEKEFNQSCKDNSELARQLIKITKEKFSSKKNLLKSDKKEIIHMLEKLEREIGCNMEYQLSQFHEQVEQSKVEAKAEIEMFWQNKILQIAQQALVENVENSERFIETKGQNMVIELE